MLLASLVWKLPLLALVIYIGVVVLMYGLQRRLVFPATGQIDAALAASYGFAVVQLNTDDGLELAAYWRPPATTAAPVVLRFHGNATDVTQLLPSGAELAATGAGVLLFAYRGYAGNPGQPTEALLHADADQAVRWLAAHNVTSERLILFGWSLGSAVAGALAQRLEAVGAPARLLVLEAPFRSMVAVVTSHYPLLPVQWLLLDRFETDARLRGLKTPLLVVHGLRDGLVPASHGRSLLGLVAGPKQGLFPPNGTHINLWEHGLPETLWAFQQTLRSGRVGRRGAPRCLPAPPGPCTPH
jgi:fermentation-respiration switch protein FrsA (DUF1100 family)